MPRAGSRTSSADSRGSAGTTRGKAVKPEHPVDADGNDIIVPASDIKATGGGKGLRSTLLKAAAALSTKLGHQGEVAVLIRSGDNRFVYYPVKNDDQHSKDGADVASFGGPLAFAGGVLAAGHVRLRNYDEVESLIASEEAAKKRRKLSSGSAAAAQQGGGAMVPPPARAEAAATQPPPPPPPPPPRHLQRAAPAAAAVVGQMPRRSATTGPLSLSWMLRVPTGLNVG